MSKGKEEVHFLSGGNFAVIVDCESSRCREGSDGYARRLRFLFDCDDKSQVEGTLFRVRDIVGNSV